MRLRRCHAFVVERRPLARINGNAPCSPGFADSHLDGDDETNLDQILGRVAEANDSFRAKRGHRTPRQVSPR